MKEAGRPAVSNFGQDLSDGKAFVSLLLQITPDRYDTAALHKVEDDGASAEDRIKIVLKHAEQLKCRQFVTFTDIVNSNTRLNFGFIAGLFNSYIGIFLPSNQELKDLYNQLDSLQHANSDLHAKLGGKQSEVESLKKELDSIKQQWKQYHTDSENSIAQQIEKLRSFYTEEMTKLRSKAGEEQQGLVAKHKAEIEQREQEYQAMVESMTAKSKMTAYEQEKSFEAEKAKISRELIVLIRSLDDFFTKNESEFIAPPIDTDFAKLPSQLRNSAVKVLEMYYDKSDRVEALEKRVEHMERVNNIIGDKIQQYAEGLINNTEKKKRNILDMFFRSKSDLRN